MKKEEIDEFIEDSFKKIARHFHKAVSNFESEAISDFRMEVKKLKVFLHLINMESADGLSYRISKRMKTIYGYFGIIQNYQLQLKKTNEYAKNTSGNIPGGYVKMLERELEFWKKNSKDFIDGSYDFFYDKKEILTVLPDKLTKKAVRKFIHYTLYELQALSGKVDDYSLESSRKFNYDFLKPFITEQQSKLFDKKVIEECLKLFDGLRSESMVIVLLQTFNADKLNISEKQFLKRMENDCLQEKKELKNQLSVKLDSMHFKVSNLNEIVFADLLDK